jgi:hypothetical protein
MKFKEYVKYPLQENKEEYLLSESVHLEHSDLTFFQNLLKNPKHATYVLKSYSRDYTEDEREVSIKSLDGNARIVIEFNMDFLELVQEIIDICDDLGFVVKDSRERNINMQYLEIYR